MTEARTNLRLARNLLVRLFFVLGLTSIGITACSPTVKVQAPDKPIVINLNIKIEQEVRIKVEKGVEDLLSDNPDIF
ncbi:MAG: YnbE family lipoprotein [Rhodospirillaceae bacterium]|nr:YnbE family lipoprotein [Rhodospirillaceae bacterium]MBT5241415.1 YnbE family lipoprotein [Rhodospirillaceae bacterium]MBT5566607.1 YnbE family lipoprotein [Rhodospirillaceae bacterium]MBT6090696.1 YnbE family lipoprotein [Rhodospirillaceae bacterium]MBT7451828.1 YnbE family lipoprotein [Rhodospirillaceae bacterium]